MSGHFMTKYHAVVTMLAQSSGNQVWFLNNDDTIVPGKYDEEQSYLVKNMIQKGSGGPVPATSQGDSDFGKPQEKHFTQLWHQPEMENNHVCREWLVEGTISGGQQDVHETRVWPEGKTTALVPVGELRESPCTEI